MDSAFEADNASETGLAGSTFELINKEDTVPNVRHTDSTSHDDSQDVFDSSISESVSSLDQFRQDDVQSLASTDQMEEEEHGLHHHYDDDDDRDDASTAPDEEGSRLTEATLVDRGGESPTNQYAEDEEHSDAESRSSIEYTHQSLGTPSILTPDASKILNPTSDDGPQRTERARQKKAGDGSPAGHAARSTPCNIVSKVHKMFSWLLQFPPPAEDLKAWETYRDDHWLACEVWHTLGTIRRSPSQIAVGVIALYLASTMMGYATTLLRPATQPAPGLAAIEKTTTTVAIVPTTPLALSTETAQAVDPTTGVALIPLHESHGDEWLFGYKIPSVSFTPEGESGVLIHVEPSIPKTWTAQRECVKIHATRGEKTIPLKIDFTSLDAIHVDFARSEAHGVVQIKLSSKCRPKFEKSVKVHFGKGIMGQVFGYMGDLTHIVAGLEANVKNVDRALTSAKESACGLLSTGFSSATEMLGPFGHGLRKASQEAGRRFHEAEGSLKAVSDRTDKPFNAIRHHGAKMAENSRHSVGKLLDSVKDNVVSGASYAVRKAAASQQAHQAHLKDAVSGIDIDGMQQQLRFGLLDAQVSAKAWWLKVTGRVEKSEEYRQRAKEFIDELHAFSAHSASTSEKTKSKSRRGQRGRDQKCKSTAMGRGQRGTHQCEPAS